MLDKVFRSILILATLHLHAPLCRLHACCAVPDAAITSTDPEEDICECCRKIPKTTSDDDCTKKNLPLEGGQKSSPCRCLCGIIALGYVPLTSVVQAGVVHLVSSQFSVGDQFNKQDGFEEGIDRPPR